MKILFICESFPVSNNVELTGGVESRDFYTIKGLAQKHKVTVLTTARVKSKRTQEISKIKIKRLGIETTEKNRENILTRISFYFTCLRFGLKEDFDIVCGTNTFVQIPAFTIGFIKAKPKAVIVHDVLIGSWFSHFPFIIALVGELLERIQFRLPWDKVIAVSKQTRKKIKRHNKKITSEVIYGGVDNQRIRGLKVKKFKYPTIIYAGRLVSYKNVDTLVRAVSVLSKKIKNLQLLVIGDGDQKQNLEAQVSQDKLSKNVKFLGQLGEHEIVLKKIKQSHIFCNPSLVEGFGLVTIEAAASGVPYVNADIPITREVTCDGKGGLLYNSKDHKQLTKNIHLLLKDSDLYRKKIIQGVKLAQKYDWQNTIKKTEEEFKKCTGKTA